MDGMTFVDDIGEVWIGPFKGEGFKYLRFHGARDNGEAIWCWERSWPGIDWELLPYRKFVAFLKLYGVTVTNLKGLEVAT